MLLWIQIDKKNRIKIGAIYTPQDNGIPVRELENVSIYHNINRK